MCKFTIDTTRKFRWNGGYPGDSVDGRNRSVSQHLNLVPYLCSSTNRTVLRIRSRVEEGGELGLLPSIIKHAKITEQIQRFNQDIETCMIKFSVCPIFCVSLPPLRALVFR